MEHKMSFKKSLKNDYWLDLPLIFSLVFSGTIIYLGIKKTFDFELWQATPLSELIKTLDFQVFAGFSVIIIAGLVCFLKRLAYIKSFENAYKTVDAKVVDIHYVKDRCGVDVEFMFNGENCKKHFALFNNNQTKYVHMDSQVQLLVKDDNPKNCLIQDLYFD